MKVDEFIKKVEEGNFKTIFDVMNSFKDLILIKKFQNIKSYDYHSFATNYYRLEDGVVSIRGLFGSINLKSNKDYCKAKIEVQKLPCNFKIGDLVEFKNKNPGSTGLSHNSIYKYLGDCEMKDNMYGWIPAVMYSSEERIYIRRQDDFVRKFKLKEDFS